MPSAPGSERRAARLGRGLDVLIGGAAQTDLAHVPVDAVHLNPRQPRRRIDGVTVSGLAESIRQQGVVQPVVVRRARREAGS